MKFIIKHAIKYLIFILVTSSFLDFLKNENSSLKTLASANTGIDINFGDSIGVNQNIQNLKNRKQIYEKEIIEKVKKGEGSKLEQLQIEQQYRTYQTLSMTSKLGLDSAIQRFNNVWRFFPHNIGEMPTPIADLLGLIPQQGTAVNNNTTLRIAQMDIDIAKEQLRFSEAEFKPRVDGKL